MVVWAIVGHAYGVQTTVRLDVVTPDPNDPNLNVPLIEATANQPIAYAITAIVEADDANVREEKGTFYFSMRPCMTDRLFR
jgi:hypothetical protein